MGSRGTYASPQRYTKEEYETVGHIYGVKIVQGKGKVHNEPEYSKTSDIYVFQNRDGSFKSLRVYDEKTKRVKLEIAYHIEPSINKGNRKDKVLHYHEYTNEFYRQPARNLSNRPDLIKKYSHLWEGFKNEKW